MKVKDKKVVRTGFDSAVVIKDNMWFVDWEWAYLCKVDLSTLDVVKKYRIPDKTLLHLMNYRYIKRCDNRYILLMPMEINELLHIKGDKNDAILFFDTLTEKFEYKVFTYAFNEMNKSDQMYNGDWRFYDCYNINEELVFIGSNGINKDVYPFIVEYNYQDGLFHINKQVIESLKNEKGNGFNFGLTSLINGNQIVIPFHGNNKVLFYNIFEKNATVKEIVDCGRIFFCFRRDDEVCYCDNTGLFRITDNRVDYIYKNKRFEHYVTGMLFGDYIIFSCDDFIGIESIRITTFENRRVPLEGKKINGNTFMIDACFPIIVYGNLLYIYSTYSGMLYILNESLSLIVSSIIDMIIDESKDTIWDAEKCLWNKICGGKKLVEEGKFFSGFDLQFYLDIITE